jgi:hypothetical protein
MSLRACLLLLGLSCLQTTFAQTSAPKPDAAAQAAANERYTATSKRFSLPVPTGWKNIPGENHGLRDNVFMHPKPVQGFAANMVFIEETAPAKLKLGQLVDSSLGLMEKNMPGYEASDRQELKTVSGVTMIRVRYQCRFLPNSVTSKNAAYFVLLKDSRLLTITVSGIAATPAEHAAEADAAILKLENTP